MGNLLIRCKYVLTMDSPEGFYTPGEIAVRGNQIYHVGLAGSAPEDFKPERVIDYPHMVALPGFVNCHNHAAMTLLRGYADDMPLMQWLNEKIWPMEDQLTGEDIYKGSLLACAEMIKGGTTTFADMYFNMDWVARAVEETGMRAVLSRGIIGADASAEVSLNENIAFVEKWHNGANGRITAMFGPHAPYTCPPEMLKKVIAEAKKLNVGIHIHLAETEDEMANIREQYGKTPVALMEDTGLFAIPVLAAHCVHLSPEDIEVLVKHQVGIAHNPQSNMKLSSGVAPVAQLLASGAVVGVGTDGASSNNNLDMLEELRAASFMQKLQTKDAGALPAYQALYLATAGGAKVLGLTEQTGRLMKGLKADIILMDLDKPHMYPLYDVYAQIAYAAASADVHTVIIDGQIVMENRHLLTMDEPKVLTDAQSCAEALARRKKAAE